MQNQQLNLVLQCFLIMVLLVNNVPQQMGIKVLSMWRWHLVVEEGKMKFSAGVTAEARDNLKKGGEERSKKCRWTRNIKYLRMVSQQLQCAHWSKISHKCSLGGDLVTVKAIA